MYTYDSGVQSSDQDDYYQTMAPVKQYQHTGVYYDIAENKYKVLSVYPSKYIDSGVYS